MKSSVLQVTVMVLASPTSSLNVIWISVGDSVTVEPFSGVELATEFSASATLGMALASPATASMPRNRRLIRRPDEGTTAGSFTIARG